MAEFVLIQKVSHLQIFPHKIKTHTFMISGCVMRNIGKSDFSALQLDEDLLRFLSQLKNNSRSKLCKGVRYFHCGSKNKKDEAKKTRVWAGSPIFRD